MKITRIIVIISALAVILYALFPVIAHIWVSGQIDDEIVNSDFETGDLMGWTKTGNAFDHQPTLGDNTEAREREGSNHQGEWWIGGYEKYQGKDAQEPGDVQGDEPTGTLTSAPFTIREDRISFLIGGGEHRWVEPDGAGSACVNLLVDGKVVKTATGSDSEAMRQYRWDVSKFRGKTAAIKVVDGNTGGWGHINLDHIFQTTKWRMEKGNLIPYLWAGITLLLAALERRRQDAL